MDEQLVAFLRELIDRRNEQLEKRVPDISAAAQCAVTCLTGNNQIHLWGNGNCHSMASLLASQLLHNYQIERPGLPAILLDTDPAAAKNQLRALGKPGDLLILFSNEEHHQGLFGLLKTGQERNIRSLSVGNIELEHLCEAGLAGADDLAVFLDVSHKAQLLDCQLAVAFSLAGLIDHLLFGSDL